MSAPNPEWTELLDETERAFLKRFLLCGGSLKDLAKAYDVSYPTVRQRLDRLVDKVNVMDQLQSVDPYERLLRSLLSEGSISVEAFKQLLDGYRKCHPAEAAPETKANT